PPAAQLLIVVRSGDAADVGQGVADVLGLWPAAQQQVESALGAFSLGLQQIGAAGGEGGAAEEMGSPLAPPRVGGSRAPGVPGPFGIDIGQTVKRRGHAAPHGCRDSLAESDVVVDVVSRALGLSGGMPAAVVSSVRVG